MIQRSVIQCEHPGPEMIPLEGRCCENTHASTLDLSWWGGYPGTVQVRGNGPGEGGTAQVKGAQPR